MSSDASKSLIVAATIAGQVVVWQTSTGKQIATWQLPHPAAGLAVIGRTVYATLIDGNTESEMQRNSIITLSIDQPDQPPKDLVAKKENQLWVRLSASPDGRTLAATKYDIDSGSSTLRVVMVNSKTGVVTESYDGQAVAWLPSGGFVLFNQIKPLKTLFPGDGKTPLVTDWAAGEGWHGSGQPERLNDLAITSDGKTAYAVYDIGSALVKWEQQDPKGLILSMTPGLVFALDVIDRPNGSGIVATSGDDGFVRFWNLPDYALKREVHVPVGVPQGVVLLGDGHTAIFSFSDDKSPTSIIRLDLDTGVQKKLLSVNKPKIHVMRTGAGFVFESDNRLVVVNANGHKIRELKLNNKVDVFAVSANGQWLAAKDDKNTLYLFEIAKWPSGR